MRPLYYLVIILGFILSASLMRVGSAQQSLAFEEEVRQFFEQYLAVYNRRFDHPQDDTAFKEDMAGFLHGPLLQLPPTSPPRLMESAELAASNFAGFVALLEQKGVRRLYWHEMQLQVLTPTKVLANNIGHGVDAEGNVVYETISVYLLYKSEAGWRIVVFSPYQMANKFEL
ncbi:MAG: hypothetical protein Tsb002_36390 [Wenzhouxiangellaceae bacterium]